MSDNNDPFAAFGSDRTVIKPSAGRAPRAASAAPEAAGAAGGRDGRERGEGDEDDPSPVRRQDHAESGFGFRRVLSGTGIPGAPSDHVETWITPAPLSTPQRPVAVGPS